MMNELLGEVTLGVEGVAYGDDLLIVVIIVLIPRANRIPGSSL